MQCPRCEPASLTLRSRPRAQASATGRNNKALREFLEKNYKEGMASEECVTLAVRTLMEVRGAAAQASLLRRR